ncbi:hypothetical protein Y1Q_0005197 [Alligator mississippiensis]|uniref:Uncharacterized protein n=1 Tax=Alligator mississippiensis TaxID=8496 RepID=A0A151MT10_ALLMI|nr:hypothetical protein Y1Q_0005197 [Alligator mississippiensis]
MPVLSLPLPALDRQTTPQEPLETYLNSPKRTPGKGGSSSETPRVFWWILILTQMATPPRLGPQPQLFTVLLLRSL